MALADLLSLARAKLTGGRFGPATTHKVVNDHDRVEPMAAQLVAAVAGLGGTEDSYTLARVIASEAGNLAMIAQLCIADAVLNECAAAKVSVLHKVTTPGAAYPLANAGYYGEQRTRWCASRVDPKEAHHEVAKVALGNRALAITRGARRWISCKVQDGGSQNGKPLAYDAVGIVKKWGGEGWEWIGDLFDPLGVELFDPYSQCMFKLVGAGKANIDKGVAMVEAHRKLRPKPAAPVPDGGGRDADGESILPVVLAAGAAAAYYLS